MDNLNIEVEKRDSGVLVFENHEYIYSYSSENKNDFISLTMPVRQKDYIHTKLQPIFEMHLPEGYLLSIIKKHFSKFTKTDDYGLLKLIAPSVHARVTYKSVEPKSDYLSLDELVHPKTENLFDELVSRFALRSALSGVQPKVLAAVQDKATLKVDDYIVKSWGEEYKELALNEYYCMKILKESGVKVPEFYISDDEKLFIMKRFDKQEDGSYLGFEDMCVLMAKQRDDKYEGSCEQIVKTIKTFVSPPHKRVSLENFFKMTVINYLVQNGDAHLKNFGLVYDGIEDISLAPAYDVVCTTAYIKNDIPALHLLGSKKWWDKKYLLRFGVESCELSKSKAQELFDTCHNSLLKIADEIKERMQNEKATQKRELLNKLYDVFTLEIQD